MPAPLRLGIVVDSDAKLVALRSAAQQAGQLVTDTRCVSTPESLDAGQLSIDVDAWLVDMDCSDPEGGANHSLQVLSALSVPVIVSDSTEVESSPAERSRWSEQLTSRLRRLAAEINLQAGPAAQNIWILAASTGGPEAVSEFLQHLPGRLPVAFLYVQHIGEGYSPALINMLTRSGCEAYLAEPCAVLKPGSTTLIDPGRRVDVQSNGTLMVSDEPWGGGYKPSIDQLVANVARTHGARCGVIVFSGMGEDGAASTRLVHQQKGQVWVQRPDSCVVDSMPRAAIATGCVSRTGTPAELAEALTRFVNNRHYFQEQANYERSATH
ncbi:chemotaxis protein CheB [Gilvimarinus xylanilyticus]|uniref:protein-glutamate methylesterase n=1 Tax=Gilvimarinus xylanilyticus TaxID=2944139 RepID=A0A9X2KU30_9GAMM|nr:chemotaxis protein CheB [Gilvimarinus xylanilyticus]MCP8899924.1 chemotaxis protein CheB [Gilvimarinus xylanilyticus]